jgi:PIN domain nuclease of toxin-antitoxin system
VLVDTNVLIAAHRSPQRLGKNTVSDMQRHRPVYFSPLSVFELVQKDRMNAWLGPLIEATARAGFKELPLTARQAENAVRFGNLRGSDPFDWLLLAQAAGAKQDFYTFDARLLALGLDFVVDASR